MGLSDRSKSQGKIKKNPSADEQEFSPSAKPVLNTNIDLVYQEVLEKETIPLISLASKFKVSLNRIEEWARVLDKQGLLELYYPMMGGAKLRVKASKQAKKPEKPGKKDSQKQKKQHIDRSMIPKLKIKWQKENQ